MLWGHLVFMRGLFPLQMMMQYLYYGGTEAMDIPASDILEVRSRCWEGRGSQCAQRPAAGSQPRAQRHGIGEPRRGGGLFEDLLIPCWSFLFL